MTPMTRKDVEQKAAEFGSDRQDLFAGCVAADRHEQRYLKDVTGGGLFCARCYTLFTPDIIPVNEPRPGSWDQSWRVVTLVPGGKYDIEQTVFNLPDWFGEVWNAAKRELGWAVFQDKQSAPDGSIRLYFTPATAVRLHDEQWFRSLSPKLQDDPPRASDVELLCGDPAALKLLKGTEE
ncbi:MAG: hypothetical protein LC753_11130 [Acidobacteria bacterium]|nr:hypothetical protein [Acidobacteriota bacterium]MCA1650797.1 hypothetical protein [Acidobacteriota bacterium]